MTQTPWCYANDPLVITIPIDQGDEAATPLPAPIDSAVGIARAPDGTSTAPTVTTLPGEDVVLSAGFDVDQLDMVGTWFFQVRVTKGGIPAVVLTTPIEVRESLF